MTNILESAAIKQVLWTEAVEAVGLRAQAKLPQANGRIERAVDIVLAGGVELLPDGTAMVQSQSGAGHYKVNGTCQCIDALTAPHNGACKHRLARSIYKKAQTLLAVNEAVLHDASELVPDMPLPAQPVVLPGTFPEAPASANVFVVLHGRKVQITLRDQSETRLLQRLDAVLAQFPVDKDPYSTDR